MIDLKGLAAETLADSFVLCLLSYSTRECGSVDGIAKVISPEELLAQFSFRNPTIARKISEKYKSRFELIQSIRLVGHSFTSGLDVLVAITDQHILVAADGTDPRSKQRGEFFGDLRDGLKLALGLRPRQMADLVSVYRSLSDFRTSRKIIGTGHSLGGYLQKSVALDFPSLVDTAVVFNAPGFVRRKSYTEFNKIYSLSAIEPVTLFGKHYGERVWLRRCFSHGLGGLSKHLPQF